MEKKIQKRFVYDGFGFPLVLCNVPMVRVRGSWTPNIDYNKLQKDVTRALAYKPLRLTGNEIHFIRQYFKMTLAEFGDRFSVSHPAVIKWEDSKDDATAMKWSVEKDIRLFILDRMGCKAGVIGELYLELKKEAKRGTKPIQMNLAA